MPTLNCNDSASSVELPEHATCAAKGGALQTPTRAGIHSLTLASVEASEMMRFESR